MNTGHVKRITVFAPGRVNIIGEHVDYPQFKKGAHNYSLPFSSHFGMKAILKGTRGDGTISAKSIDYNDTFTFNIKDIGNIAKTDDPGKSWRNYLLGTLSTANEQKLPISSELISGLDIEISGNVPIGVGMSSSAAMCVSLNMALNYIFDWNKSKVEIAKLSQLAEHSRFVGVKCGLLDQTASLFGKKGNAVLINYGNMEDVKPVSLDPIFNNGYKFLVVNSGVPRGLGGTFYNDRRNELIELGSLLAKSFNDPERDHISMYNLSEYNRNYLSLSNEHSTQSSMHTLLQRGTHVLEEKQRTLDFIEAAEQGYVALCCRLINECGYSLSEYGQFNISGTVIRDDQNQVIEVRPYLDILREILQNSFRDSEKSVGIRMLGGGGGGCTLLLMPEAFDKASWRDEISSKYREGIHNKYQQDLDIAFYEAEPSDGARVISN